MSRYDVEGRTVLITGGARGIGADAARRLAQRGALVALVDRDADALERVAAGIGERAAAFTADVTDREALDRAVAGAVDRFGGIDVAIANAGVSGTPCTVAAIDPEEFERVIEINLLGVWRTVRVGVGYFSFIDTDMVRDASASPGGGAALSALPGALGKPIPVGAAGKAIVRGVERRATRVYAPRWIPGMLALRGFGGPLESLAARHPRLIAACREVEALPQR